MKRFLLLLASVATLMVGCDKGEALTAVELEKVTRSDFDWNGGLASATVYAGDIEIEAVSGDESWCRVAVLGSTVHINVLTNMGNQPRATEITVSAADLKPLVIPITQEQFKGLVVTPTNLVFTDDSPTLSVLVSCSSDYKVEMSEDVNNNFSFAVSPNKSSVAFTVNCKSGENEVSGRAIITALNENGEPDTEIAPVTISLKLPEKSTYDFLLGDWSVVSCAVGVSSVKFERKVTNASFYVSFDTLPNVKFTADFINGQVVIKTAQQLGVIDGLYYSLHFNGSQEGSSSVLVFTTPGSVAWAANIEFLEATRSINLNFTDNGQGRGQVAKTLKLTSCMNKYFNFWNSSEPWNDLLGTDYLEISKSY